MVTNPLLSPFLVVVDRYLDATGGSETSLSKVLFGRSERLGALRAGAYNVGVHTLNEVLGVLSERWPDGTAWPDVVPRPKKPRPKNTARGS
jgi:hypothetical protein